MRSNTLIAGMCAVLMFVLCAAFAVLLFYVPVLVDQWADLGKALSDGEKVLIVTSNVCRRYPLFIVPVLLLGTLGSIVWLVSSFSARDD